MPAPIRTNGPTLADALSTAVAELVGSDVEKVDLRLSAPGLDDVTGTVTFELEVASDDVEPVADAGEQASEERDEQGGPVAEAPPAARPSNEAPAPATADELEEEADAAADFVEGLLDALDLPGDLKIRIGEEHAEVEIDDVGSGVLIGRRGQTLDAIQELMRCSLQRQFERRCQVQIDVEGYRARRLEKLLEKAQEAIDDVLDSGESERLEPMDVFERKAVHKLVTGTDGVDSHSQGREPGRRVVIEPA